MSDPPLSQILGEAQMRAVHEALKPHLRAFGVGLVEERIGKPRRFFENVRHRGSFRLQDYLATCVALDLDPVELAKGALSGQIAPDVRPPRIVTAAWKLLGDEGPGLGAERMAELEALVQVEPRKSRSVLTRELPKASREELPRLLGFCASAFRVESRLARAELMLRQALEIASALEMREAEPDLLIRMAHVALERERLPDALRWAQEGTLGYTRLLDAEGQGRGFLTMGMLRYYSKQYRDAIHESKAALAHFTTRQFRLASHQLAATSFAALREMERARRELSAARTLASDAPEWMLGKLTWLEARLDSGEQRLAGLQVAKEALAVSRPADCALVTIELIEQALSLGSQSLAEQETVGLCALVERNLTPRIEKAIVRLLRHQSKLTRRLVSEIRRALERGQSQRLAALIATDTTV